MSDRKPIISRGIATMTTLLRPTADELNAKIADGGFVQVTTCTRSVIYRTSRKDGWFVERNGNLFVRRGRAALDKLTIGERLLVSIRTGKFA